MPPAGIGKTAQARARLIEVLTPVVATTGHDLEDVTVTEAGRRSLVRVIVDADGGVDLDAVADVSRAISETLDGDGDGDAFAGPYVLEVSSPGVDRPLTEPRHWRRARARLVQVSAAGTTLTGRITATDERGVVFDVDGTAREIAWADLGDGRVQVEFNRPGASDDTDDTDDTDETDETEQVEDDVDDDETGLDTDDETGLDTDDEQNGN